MSTAQTETQTFPQHVINIKAELFNNELQAITDLLLRWLFEEIKHCVPLPSEEIGNGWSRFNQMNERVKLSEVVTSVLLPEVMVVD